MAKLRVLLPFNGLIKKNLNNPFFRPYFAHFRPKIGHFLHFFRFWALFSLRGGRKIFFRPNFFFNSFYIPKWSQKKLFGNIIFFRWICIPILGKSENRFISLFYLKLKNAQKYPLRLVGENGVCPKCYQKPFISGRFGPIWTH